VALQTTSPRADIPSLAGVHLVFCRPSFSLAINHKSFHQDDVVAKVLLAIGTSFWPMGLGLPDLWGSSGVYFPPQNNGDSSYVGGRQLAHYEINRLDDYAYDNELIDQLTGSSEILELSGVVNQHILLKRQNAGTVFAGPPSGCTPPCSPAYPSFRPLVFDDIPDLTSEYATNTGLALVSGQLNTHITNVSGIFRQNINTVSGIINTNTSTLSGIINTNTVSLSGLINNNFNTLTALSGILTNYINTIVSPTE
jgi:hypothetical protein